MSGENFEPESSFGQQAAEEAPGEMPKEVPEVSGPEDNYDGGYSKTAYGYQVYEEPKKESMAFGIVSLVLGVISFVLFCSCINIPLAIAALIFGIIHLAKYKEGKALAIGGIISAVLSILCFLILAVSVITSPIFRDEFQEEYKRQWEKYYGDIYGNEYDYDYDEDHHDTF